MTSGKILVVEDRENWQETYRDWFSTLDYVVQTTGTLEGANKLCDEHDFDVAIVDINLSQGPGNRDGLKVISRLRESKPRTEIVVVSGSIDPDVQEKLRAQEITFVQRADLRYRTFIETISEKMRKARSN